jgi:hypothetical protein
MVKPCPLCKGEKVIPASNGTQGEEHQPCTVCGGYGEVDEQRKSDKPIIIYKPWGIFSG